MFNIFWLIFPLLFLSFLLKPKVGIYLLAFLIPVIGWEISIASFVFPFIDLVALSLLLAFVIRLAYFSLFDPLKVPKLRLPLFLPFFLFLLVSFLSAIFSTEVSYSLWYFCRWPLFLYLAYIFLPYNLINDQKTLKKTIIAATISSIIVLIFGFLSLIGQDWRDSFFRLSSVSINGVFPFGANHNLIAEFLNVGAFFVLALRLLVKDARTKRFFDIIFLFSVLGIILTFSRSAWIVLLLQILSYLVIFLKDKKMEKKDFLFPLILIFLLISPLFLHMSRLQENNVSSTENRVLLTEISLQALKEKPVLGYGSGSFINLVDKNLRFKAKYGEAIDAHGFIQKTIAENGLLGFIAWTFIFLVILKTFWQAIKKHGSSHYWLSPLILGASGGLFFQLLNTSYYKGKVWLPIVLALLAIKLLDNNYNKKNVRKD